MQRYAEQLILFAESNASTPPSTPVTSEAVPPAGPSWAMGAIDAYREPTLSDDRPRAQLPNGHHPRGTGTPLARAPLHSAPESETEAETETETETENETDAETDDEPTIRPTHSEDGGSVYRFGAPGVDEDDTGDEDEDQEEGVWVGRSGDGRKDREFAFALGRRRVDPMMDSTTDGDSTPERRPARDEHMASP